MYKLITNPDIEEMKSRNGVLEAVYECLRDNVSLESVHIPHSDVFYVREALEARFDCELSLSQAEEYMKEAGWRDTGKSKEQNKG